MEKRKPDDDVRRLLKEIQYWEKRIVKKSFLENVVDGVFKPIGWVFNHLPRGVLSATSKAIEGVFGVLILTSNYTFSNNSIFRNIVKNKGSDIEGLEDIRNQPILSLSKTARSHFTENELVAMLEGAGCGLGGFALIAADIPLLFSISFRVIQQIGTTFGYDMESPLEKQLMINLIDFSASPSAIKVSTMFNKDALLDYIKKTTLKEMESITAIKAGEISLEEASRSLLKKQGKRATKKAVQEMAVKLTAEASKNGAKATAITTARKNAQKIGQELTKNKLAQLIPLIGALIGAGFNFWFVSKVADSAYYFYLKRHIDDNYAEEQTYIEIG